MFLNHIILCQFQSLRLIRSCKKSLGTVQIVLIASLLMNSFGQEQLATVDKTANFTSALNKSAVHEPPPFLLISNDVDLKNLTRVYLDAHVAGYASKEIRLNIKWPFENASKVWEYVKKTYGSYGLDPHIYVFFYSKVDKALKKGTSYYATHFNANYDFKNVVKLRKQSGVAWTKEVNKTAELINFTFVVGYIVESASNYTKGSPGYNNYKNKTYRSSAWNFIFIYDVLSKIGMTQEADSFLAADPSSPLTRNDLDIKESLNQRDRANWIKNWFWPIYLKYGVQALSQYITNSSSYFPRKLLSKADSKTCSFYKYAKTMNKGEFVHFWSGSVGTDLRYLANLAFTWDTNDEKNFQSARKSFPMLKYQCNKTSCDKLPVLDQLLTGFLNNIPNYSENNKLRPAITVISENDNGLDEPIRKRVKGSLYRPLNQSDRYMYDGKNELHIFEAPLGLCYYITCSAPFIIKWVTNIQLKENPSYKACPRGKYLNSLRLQDAINEASQGQVQETFSQTYTIQLMMGGIINMSDMGLLKCESIQNSSHSIHVYLTNSKLDPTRYRFPSDNIIAELFWDYDSDKTLIVPCIGASLKMMPDLRIRTKSNWVNNWTVWKTIWKNKNKNVDAELLGYNVTYDPVIGFIIAYKVWPFNQIYKIGENLYFDCLLNNTSRIEYKVYLTSKEKTVTSKLTIVDKLTSSAATGCVLIKNVDQFFFFGNETEISDYPLKLISCNTPDACDLFRRCLDYAGKYCYSEHQKLQADYAK